MFSVIIEMEHWLEMVFQSCPKLFVKQNYSKAIFSAVKFALSQQYFQVEPT